MADGCRLYIITSEKLDLRTFPDLFARALDAGDVAAVQLRLKNIPDDDWKRAIDALRPIAQAHGVAFVLNDRADLVVATGRWRSRRPGGRARAGGPSLMGAGRAGVNLLAIIGSVWHPDGPAAGVRAINAAIKVAREAP